MSDGTERRRSKRRPILDTFSLSVVLKNKSDIRLKVHDVSDQGLGFEIDIEGESIDGYSPKVGESIAIELYLNQSLSIPLKIKVVRVDKKSQNRTVGVEIQDQNGKAHQAFLGFLQIIDRLAEVAHVH